MFSGSPTKYYLPWKYSVEGGVKTLKLSSDQWFELLKHRTTGSALSLVKDSGSLVGELTMDKIVASIWEELNRLYLPKMKRSDDILNELMHGPVVFHDNLAKLEDFSKKCHLMNQLSQADPELRIISSRPSTIVGLVRRLDKILQNEWLDEEKRLKRNKEQVSLTEFHEWMSGVFQKEQDKNNFYNVSPDSKITKGCPLKNPRANTPPSRAYGGFYTNSPQNNNTSQSGPNNSTDRTKSQGSWTSRPNYNRDSITGPGPSRVTFAASNPVPSKFNNQGASGANRSDSTNTQISDGRSVNSISVDKRTDGSQSHTYEDCPWCQYKKNPQGKHRLEHCKSFEHLDKTARLKFVRGRKLCYKCLGTGHQSSRKYWSIGACSPKFFGWSAEVFGENFENGAGGAIFNFLRTSAIPENFLISCQQNANFEMFEIRFNQNS